MGLAEAIGAVRCHAASPFARRPCHSRLIARHPLCSRDLASSADAPRHLGRYRARPQDRHARLHGAARTLVGSHWRVSNSRCEFVPAELPASDGQSEDGADEDTSLVATDEGSALPSIGWRRELLCGLSVRLAAASAAAGGGRGDGDGGRRGRAGCDGLVDVGNVDAGDPPRFLTARECARLQGFPDSFAVPKSVQRNSGDSSSNRGNRPTATYVAGLARRPSSKVLLRGWPSPRAAHHSQVQAVRQRRLPSGCEGRRSPRARGARRS